MVIRKSYLYFAAAILIVIGASVTIGFRYFSKSKEVLTCTKFKDFYPFAPNCGLLTSDTANTYHQLLVRVNGVFPKGNKPYFTASTKDINGKTVTENFVFAPDSLKTHFILLPKDLKISSRTKINPKGENLWLKMADAFNRISKDDELLIQIVTPTSEQVESVIKKFGKSSYTDCFPLHQKYIVYLRKPTFSNFLAMKRESLLRSCRISLLNMTAIKR